MATSAVEQASFTDGGVEIDGIRYAKAGQRLTLAVETNSETKCVVVSGAHTRRQSSDSGRTGWTFMFTAPASDGTKRVSVTAYNNSTCTPNSGSSTLDQEPSYVVDNTGPLVTGSLAPTPNAAGWNREDVVISWSASDESSGLSGDPTPASDSVHMDTPGADRRATAYDRVGNRGTGRVTVKLDKTAPAINGMPDRAPNEAGWFKDDVTVTFACEDGLSGIAECASSTTLESEGAAQAVSGTAIDNADNSAATVVGPINIDKTAPSLAGAAVAQPNADGWYNGNVTIAWHAEDTLSGIDPTTVPSNSTIAGEGKDLMASAAVKDVAGNETRSSSPSVNIDRTAPITIAAAASTWNNADATVTFEATDALSGVKSTYYQRFGGAAQIGSSVTISEEGIHTVYYWSEDAAGNAERANRIQVKIDKTAPTIQHLQFPDANANGWNNTDVMVHFICGDGLSGVASCTPDEIVTDEGAKQSVVGVAVDHVGNTATDTASVNIDKTGPIITAAADHAPNSAGWHNADVTVTFECEDSLSGIAACPAAITMADDGSNQGVEGTALDAAGNASGTSVGGINIDKTAPTLTGAPTSAPNAQGWHTADVVVVWTCEDLLSGLDGQCPAESTVTGEGAALSAAASVSDVAGNTTHSVVEGLKIDRTPPSTHAVVPDPGTDGWHAGTVEISLSAADALSGIDKTYYTIDGGAVQEYTAPFSLGQTGRYTIHFWSVDHAGQVEDVAVPGHSVEIKVDNTAPTIAGSRTPANAFGWNNAPVLVTFDCDDADAGILDDGCAGSTTLESEGVDQVVTGTAIDKVGNTATTTVTGINIDRTPPNTAAVAPSAWSATSVVVNLEPSDAGSGVQETYYRIDDGMQQTGTSVTVAGEGRHTLTFWSEDYAGNVESIQRVPVEIDLTAPTVSITSPRDGSSTGETSVAVAVEALDRLSGVAGVTVNGASATLNEDSSYAGSVALECGMNTITASATDLVGRSATHQVSALRTCWKFHGFYKPVEMGTGTVFNTPKAGSNVALKFNIRTVGIYELRDAALVKPLVQQINCSTPSLLVPGATVPTNTSSLRWDETTQQWSFNWKTPDAVGNCYRVMITADGAATSAYPAHDSALGNVAFFRIER